MMYIVQNESSKMVRFPIVAVSVLVLFCHAEAYATIILTNTTNITLENAQVESGGDTTDNPNVVIAPTGPLLPYTETVSAGYCCGATYDGNNLDDGDIGTGNLSDGTYALPNNGALTLDLGSTQTIGSIAIYNGYGNRDDGTYLLKDGAGNTLGGWTISLTGGASNAGVDSFWLIFNSAVSSDKLVLSFLTESTASFREIQVFAPVPPPPAPEPSSLLLLGLGTCLLSMHRRRMSKPAAQHLV
jgi:hypothetical protein